jgi:hypothetical protein
MTTAWIAFGIISSVVASVTISADAAWVGIGITVIGLYGSSVWMLAGMRKDITRVMDSTTEIKETAKTQGSVLIGHGEEIIRMRTKLGLDADTGRDLS